MGKTARLEALGKHPARFEDALRGFRLAVRIEPAAQPEQVDVLFEVDEPQNLDDARTRARPRRPLRPAGSRPSRPRRRNRCCPICGLPRWHGCATARRPDRPRQPVRPVAQTDQQIVPYARRKKIGDRADIADAAAGNRQRHAVDVGFADRKPAAGRGDEAGKELRDEVSAAVALADDRHIRAERKLRN